LIVKHPEEEGFMSDSEWEEFDKLVKNNLRKESIPATEYIKNKNS